MRKTKLLALLLAVAMIASMVVPSVSAEEPYTISIVDSTGASTINANAGDSVTLSLVIANNPGVSSIGIDIKRPEGWTTARPSNKNLFSDTAEAVATFSQYTTANPYYVSWLMALGTFENEDAGTVNMGLNKENGTLATVKITIPADAATGTYTIDLSIDGREKNNFYYNVGDDGVIIPNSGNTLLTPVLEDLTINVTGTEPAGAACPEHPETTTWTDVAAADWAAGGALTSGHYKLTEDIATTAALTVAEGETVCIDLAGFDITAGAKADSTSYRVFTNDGTLTILDTTATGEGEAYTAGIISGGALLTQGNGGDHTYTGACGGNILNSGTFTLVDGIIADGYLVGGAYDSKDVGGNICSYAGTLNIKGGWIKDGENKRTSQNGSASTRRGGGNIAAFDTDVNITGGMITGGYVYGTYNYTSSTARNSYLYGGNLLVSGGSLDIANATIADGVIEYTLTSKKSTVLNYAFGGNIFIEGIGDVTVANSNITGGQVKAYSTGSSTCDVKAQGGNIWMKLSAATNKMTIDADSVISGGLTDATSGSHAEAATEVAEPDLNYRGGNIYLEKGTLDVSGKITDGYAQRGGGIFTPGNATINVYDGAEFSGNVDTAEYGHNITITANSGTLNVYGGNITCDQSAGASVYALYANVNIYGGTIENTNGGYAIMTYYSSSYDPAIITQTNGTVIGKVKVDKNCEWNVTGGTIDFSLTGTGTLTIGAGVASSQNPEAYLVDCVAYNDNGDFYVTYATFADALVAAQSGNTITLVADVTAGTVSVPSGVTLDLNGNTLTADEFSSAFEGAHIVDGVGTGKLAASSVSYAGANNQLPIAVEGGYVFETVSFKENLTVDTKAVYKFYIDSKAAQTALDDAILNGEAVAINVKVTWTNAEGTPKEKTFTLGEELLAQYAGAWDTKMVTLTINDLTGVSDLTCTAQVVANGVTVAAEA